jgi:hypothetical protein
MTGQSRREEIIEVVVSILEVPPTIDERHPLRKIRQGKTKFKKVRRCFEVRLPIELFSTGTLMDLIEELNRDRRADCSA